VVEYSRPKQEVPKMLWITAKYPPNSFAIFDKDAEDIAYCLNEDAENILAISRPRRVITPWFKLEHKTVSPTEAFNFFQKKLQYYADNLLEVMQKETVAHNGKKPNTLLMPVRECPSYNPVSETWSMTIGMMLMHFSDDDPKSLKQYAPSRARGEKLPSHTEPKQAQEHSLLVCRALSLF